MDIRVFKFTLSILPIPVKVWVLPYRNFKIQMEMIAQIGETCTQELPLINYSNKDWTLKV